MHTQKEIAQKAGVSRATVSRAFTKSTAVSPDAMIKIQNAMKSMGLDPILCNPGTQRSSKYVLISAGDISDSFYSRIIKGICDKLTQLGILSVVCNSNYNSQIEENHIHFAQSHGYLGVILITAIESVTLIELLKDVTIPVILVNRYIRALNMDAVCIDNHLGGYMATSYLIQHGHKNIAHLAGSQNSTAPQDRLRGYSDAMADAKLLLRKQDIFYGDQSQNSGWLFADNLLSLKRDYTAVFVANCPMAVGAVNRFQSLGIRIPQDISIICFDDSPTIDERGLNISCVSYEPYPMGSLAVDALIRRIEHQDMESTKILLTPKLVVRASVKEL